MFTINFHGERNIKIEVGQYRNGRLAVQLHQNGEPFATVSVNLPEEQIADGEFAFKTYSENEGLFEELLRVGAIEFTGRYTGPELRLPICQLTIAATPYKPGLWECSYSAFSESWHVFDEQGNQVAESQYVIGCEEIEDPTRSKKNAQLIAASPVLLELLEALHDWCDSNSGEVWIDQRGLVGTIIDEAIALARGRKIDAGLIRKSVCSLSEHAAAVETSQFQR